MSDKKPTFYIPTKPYTVIDCVNRAALATGSIRYAMAGHYANYNGHASHLSFNDYRQYYVGEYTWAGRCVFVRSSDFKEALRASLQEYKIQGLGASMSIYPHTDSDVEICRATPELIEGKEDLTKSEWRTWKYNHAHSALSWERQFGVPAVSILLAASTEEEYFKNTREYGKS